MNLFHVEQLRERTGQVKGNVSILDEIYFCLTLGSHLLSGVIFVSFYCNNK